MKQIKTILMVSISLNLVAGYIIIRQQNETKEGEILKEINQSNAQRHKDLSVTSSKNFDAIFLKKNDSIYKAVWSEAFENNPELAFLIASSYYHIKKDSSILKDIDVTNSEIKSIYHTKIEVK